MNTVPTINQSPRHADVIRLLEDAALPTSDLTHDHMTDFFYVGPASAPIGVVGVQFFGTDALLRSLVVSSAHRAHGFGHKLVQHAEEHARRRGARNVYLLTTTAEAFFRSRGYTDASRDAAPTAIRATPEFSSLCPASSAFLFKHLESR